MAETNYYIEGINGPVVTVKGGKGLAMMDMVSVGPEGLIGEVVSVKGDETTVQVYEDTTGLIPGMPVVPQGAPMSIALGPGLLNNIFDGICRPLRGIEAATGAFIGRGIHIPALDTEKQWDVNILVKPGDTLSPGQVYAECDETPVIRHRSMMRPDQSGTVLSVAANGSYTVEDTIVTVKTPSGETLELKLAQTWPIRKPRPVKARRSITQPLVTGQRIIDVLFPLGKGGCAAIPGPFGAGKTVTQHQLAKWSDADLIVYLGCGERGNEMTQVLDEFSELIDPHSGSSADGSNGAHCQHLQYACGSPRGVHLHRHDHCGILPGHGLSCGHDGGFHLPMGGGLARNFRPSGGNARGRGLPGLSCPPDWRNSMSAPAMWTPCPDGRAALPSSAQSPPRAAISPSL